MINQPASPTNATTVTPSNWRATLAALAALFKFRIVLLLLAAAIGGAFLGAGSFPGIAALSGLIISGGLAASGSAAWNQYLERQADNQMARTRQKRPLVNGNINNPIWVPIVATLMIAIPVVVAFPFNRALSFFLALGAFIYVVIYTVWLKPRTLLNIVIGGAAGSAAVLAGGAAAGNWSDPGVIVLALILFLWTPTHFWSLAMLYRDDYKAVDMPMLPAKTSMQQASWWVMAHTAPTAVCAILLTIVPALGWIYFIPMILLGGQLIWRNIQLIQSPTAGNAKRLFLSSNIYLLALLILLCVDAAIR